MHRGLRAVLVAVPALACLAFVARPLPAAAQATNFRQELDDIRNSLPGFGADHDPIDFSERAPLVVPPNNNLPPPTDSPTRLGVNDPDRFDRAKAWSDPRRPVPPTDPGASASGADRRAFLIEPPSGMQNPEAVAAQASESGFKDAPKRKRVAGVKHHMRRTPAPVDAAAAQ